MPKIINGFKICTKCGENKAVNEYGINRKNPSGIASWCKLCSRKIDKARINRTRTLEYKKKRRNRNLQREYGISLDDFNKLLEKQDYKCRICKTDTPDGNGYWVVDHDHKFKFVRGILCNRCNTLLGYAKDNVDILHNAINYLDLQYVAY